MGDVIGFDRARDRNKSPAVRVAFDFGYWCVERLAGYAITGRVRHPTRSDATRAAQRIAVEDGIDLLPARLPPRLHDDCWMPPDDGDAA